MAKTIKDYQKDYNDAKAKGDTAGMATAHAAADKIRGTATTTTRDSKGNYVQTPVQTPNKSGNVLNTGGGSSRSNSGDSNNIDYATPLSALLAGNPTNYNQDIVDKVQELFDGRSSKIASDPTTYGKYANDTLMQAARDYLDNAKNYRTTQDALSKIVDLDEEEYRGRYEDDQEDLVNSLKNREEFKYNYAADPTFIALANKYSLLGDSAMEDTLGDVAGLTGGMPSSYAVTAAAQAKNDYNSRITDVIPALMEAAYTKYQNGISTDMSLVNLMGDLDSSAYNKYANSKNDAFSAAQYLANYGYNASRDKVADQQYADAFAYQATRDQIQDAQWLSQFSADQQQLIVENAIKNKQISVSQGNLALSNAKFNYTKEQEDTSYYGKLLTDAKEYIGTNPGTAEENFYKYVEKYKTKLDKQEIDWLRKQLNLNTGKAGTSLPVLE